MRRLDAERIHQTGGVLGHVAQPVGRFDRNFQEPQFQQFERLQRLAAGELAGLADVAVVEADDAKPARCQLLAEFVVPQDHLGAEPHDQQHGLGVILAENFIAKVDAVGADSLRRLMRNWVHWWSLNGIAMRNLWHGFAGQARRETSTNRRCNVDRPVATVWYDRKNGL